MYVRPCVTCACDRSFQATGNGQRAPYQGSLIPGPRSGRSPRDPSNKSQISSDTLCTYFWPFFQRIPLNLNHDDVVPHCTSKESPTISLPTNCAPLPTTSLSRSMTGFVRFFDSADGVYSTSSASELGNRRHPTSLMSTARRGLKHCITDWPRLRKPREGYEWTTSVEIRH